MVYARSYGLIETLAPLHVGASAGEESGNLNLIFRDAYTQTGIIPGSSIRGRFRAESRRTDSTSETNRLFGSAVEPSEKLQGEGRKQEFTEALVKFEYASLVWLPVFSPGQPVVWVSSPRLLDRYRRIVNPSLKLPEMHKLPVGSPGLRGRETEGGKDKKKTLFFNLGFLTVNPDPGIIDLVPSALKGSLPANRLVVVDDADIGAIHDLALYRQSRVKLADDEKKVESGAFFNVEALPEGSVLVFPIGIRPPSKDSPSESWKPFGSSNSGELYFGGLESIGFGRSNVSLFNEEVV